MSFYVSKYHPQPFTERLPRQNTRLNWGQHTVVFLPGAMEGILAGYALGLGLQATASLSTIIGLATLLGFQQLQQLPTHQLMNWKGSIALAGTLFLILPVALAIIGISKGTLNLNEGCIVAITWLEVLKNSTQYYLDNFEDPSNN